MSQVVINFGTAGTALNGRLGSTSSADSNDPTFIPHPGDNDGNYIYFGGNQNNLMSIPYEAALQITGDIDIRAYVAPTSWSVAQALVSRFDNNNFPDRAFEFAITTAKRLTFSYRTSASTTTITKTSVAHTIADGEAKWVRVTLDVDNGNSQNVTRFYLSDDGETWTQLGTDIVTAGVTDINNGGVTELLVLGRRSSGSSIFVTGKYYRAQLFNGIDGTKVVDIDTSVITTGSQTTLTALTGQTVTIGTSTSGKKTVRVVSPVWLIGTDDYIEVLDNSLMDFDANESFSLLAIIRQWNTPLNFGAYAGKVSSTAGTSGYLLYTRQTNLRPQSTVKDASTTVDSLATVNNPDGSLQVYGMVIDRATQEMKLVDDGVVVDTDSISAVGSLANTSSFLIGRQSGATVLQQDFELIAVCLFRKTLTTTEIGRIVSYYQARLT